MPRTRDEKEYFWTFRGTVKEFREALKKLSKTKHEVFEPTMLDIINKANKQK